MRWPVPLMLLLLCGCEQVREVIIDVHTDLVPGASFDSVDVTGLDPVLRSPALATDYRAGVRLPSRRVLGDVASFRIALTRGGREVLGRDVVLRVPAGTSVLPIHLLVRCANVTCPNDDPSTTECDSGRCVAPECSELHPELCPAEPACRVATDCGGTVSTCGGFQCNDGRCEFVALPVCDPGQTCDAFLGCVRPMGADAPAPIDAPVPDVPGLDAPDAPSLPDAPLGCMPGDACDDGNPCTRDGCDAGTCRSVSDDLLPYDDGDACTEGDRCAGGVGVPGTPRSCDDGVACTVDACVGGTCQSVPDDGLCTAAAGGRCDAAAGCQYGGTCDARTCFPESVCEETRCIDTATCQRSPVGCADDGNPCTDEVCVPSSGCQHIPNAAACDDGDACTVGDLCVAGTCQRSPRSCEDFNACTADTCDTVAGCISTPLSGVDCVSSDPCVTGSTCMAGTCVPGGPVDCDDGNLCTSDSCDTGVGCTHIPRAAGADCSVPEVCITGTCDAFGVCQAMGCPPARPLCCSSVCTMKMPICP